MLGSGFGTCCKFERASVAIDGLSGGFIRGQISLEKDVGRAVKFASLGRMRHRQQCAGSYSTVGWSDGFGRKRVALFGPFVACWLLDVDLLQCKRDADARVRVGLFLPVFDVSICCKT